MALTEFLQKITTFGDYLSFRLDLTELAPSGLTPDAFSFFLLDTDQSLLIDTDDPTGAAALFAVDIDGSSSGVLSRYAPVGTDISWQVIASAAVPVPSTAWLLLAAIVGGLVARGRATVAMAS